MISSIFEFYMKWLCIWFIALVLSGLFTALLVIKLLE
jgi:hypothetical protein